MEIKPLTGAFGAEVLDVDLKSGIGTEESRLIEAALAENVVLVFRNQDFTKFVTFRIRSRGVIRGKLFKLFKLLVRVG